MDYELTRHTIKVMAERGLSAEWLERGLKSPERVEPDEDDAALEHHLVRIPEFGGRMLRVIVNKDSAPIRVVTIYFDRSVKGKP